jgi:hypothetical protein
MGLLLFAYASAMPSNDSDMQLPGFEILTLLSGQNNPPFVEKLSQNREHEIPRMGPGSHPWSVPRLRGRRVDIRGVFPLISNQ